MQDIEPHMLHLHTLDLKSALMNCCVKLHVYTVSMQATVTTSTTTLAAHTSFPTSWRWLSRLGPRPPPNCIKPGPYMGSRVQDSAELQVKRHVYPPVHVEFPGPSTPVIIYENIDRSSGPISSGLSLPISFQFCS